MWTLTSDNLERAKIELNDRRAAAEARYVAEIKALDTDLEEIETLARVAHSFSLKHPSGADIMPDASDAASAPAATEPEEDRVVAQLEMGPAAPNAPEPETAEAPPAAVEAELPTAAPNSRKEPAANPDAASKGGSSRWRIRIPTDKEMASNGI